MTRLRRFVLAALPLGRSDLRMTLSVVSILKGPPSQFTVTLYSSANSFGTRHEYEQVKPQPYRNLPCATFFSALVIVNSGSFGRLPLTTMLLTSSPPAPTRDRRR